MLLLKLLGTPAVEAASGPVTGRAAQGPRLALLAVLALARGRFVSRDKLIALLWPESPADRARQKLSDAVYLVRAALGDDVIRSAGDDLGLDPEVIGSDVERFVQLLDDGRPDLAVELYGGPLLDGFHLSGAAEFERWLDLERAHLGQRYAGAVASLADASEREGQATAAVSWWRRAVAQDPYNGQVALRLMRALEAAGDRAGALKHARVHAALLREEFDAAPDPEVAAYAERLRREPAAPQPREPVVGPPEAQGSLGEGARSAPPGRPRRARDWAAAAALVLVVALTGLYGVRQVGRATPSAAPRSVAVLPFVNLSPDRENTYFSDGLSEQVIGALSRLEGLRVAARTSSFALRDRGLHVRAIGDTLGVAAVLEGSVRKDGNHLRVTAQLVDAATGYRIWSDEYDRELRDVFAVQEEIAAAISAALEVRLDARRSTAGGRPEPDLQAYDLYLRGLFLRNSLTADGLRRAVEHFDRAIARAPDFALAYASKASVIAPAIYFGHVDRAEGVRQLRALTARALALDSTLGEAHAALGILRLFFEWDWDGAEQALRRAIALNPSDAHAYHHLANYLRVAGRFEEMIAARERAVELDPLNARTRFVLGADYAVIGDYRRAIAEYRRAQRLDPVHPLALGLGPGIPSGVAEVYRRQGRYGEAVVEYLKLAVLREATERELSAMRRAFEASGMPGFWREWLALDLRQSGGSPDPLRHAILWGLTGDTAQSLRWLERAYEERNPGLIYVRTYPGLDSLLSDPRAARILSGLKLPGR